MTTATIGAEICFVCRRGVFLFESRILVGKHFLSANASTAMNDDVVLPSLPSQLYIFGNNEVQFPSSNFYSSSHNKLNAHSRSSGFSITSSNLFMEDIGGDGDDFVIPHHFLAANGQSGSSFSTTNRLDSLSSNCQTYIPSFSALPQQSVLPSKKLKIPEFEPVISNEDRSPMEAHSLLLGGKHHIHMAGLSEFTRNKKRKTWTAEKPRQQHIQTTMESLVDKKNYKAPVMKRSQKLSDRITALQKLVSPYGKTDTASVLQEAVIYIKLLQERIKNAFEAQKSSNPIFMTRPIILPQAHSTMAAEHRLSMRQGSNEINLPDDLRSRGLCLVPISMIQNLTKDDRAAASASTSSRIGSIGY